MKRSVTQIIFFVAAILLPSLRAQQLTRFPGSTPVSTSAGSQTAVLQIVSGGTVDKIKVTTQGSEGLDFSNLGTGSCGVGSSYLPGQTCSVTIGFIPKYPGQRLGAVTLLDKTGTVLSSSLLTGSATGPINTFIPGTITTIAGDTAWIFAGDGGQANQSAFFLPFGVAVSAAGDLYIADSSNNRIRKVDAKTNLVSTIAGTGIIGASGDKAPALLASLSNPSSVALDPAGNLYFSDSGNNAIRRIDAATGIITTIAGTLGVQGYSGDGSLATNATLNAPNGIAFDVNGNLYVADTANHVIRRIDVSTHSISTIAGRGVPAYGGDGGAALSASLNAPWSVTVAPTGELYIADQGNHRIREIGLSGNISTIAGTGTPGFKGDGAAAPMAQLNVPASVAIDVAGNLYIADSGNNRVRKISAQTGFISTIAGNSGESITGDDGPADQAGLYGPYTLALDGADNLFIADVFHNRIRKITSNSASLLFPPMRVGRVAVPLVQTLENDGNAPLVVSSLRSVANAQPDAVTSTCVASLTLAPFGTCKIGVSFAPTVTGTLVTGYANVNSDASNAPGTIVLTGEVLDTDPTTLTLTSSVNPGLTNIPVTFSVTATSAGTIPTGTMTFLDGTAILGTTPVQAGGIASLTTSSLSSGQHNITVSYSGDSSNAAAVSSILVETIKDSQAATVTTLTSPSGTVSVGAPLLLTATVSTKNQGSGTAAISGKVNFFDGSTSLGSATISTGATFDQGTATLSLSTLPIGSHTLTATYVGTLFDSGSTSAPLTEVVTIATTKLTLTTTANPAIAGAPFTLTSTIVSSGSVPTGKINFLSGSTVIGSGTLSAQGVVTLSYPAITWLPGTYVLSAAYAGDSNTTASSSPVVNEVLQQATTGLTLTSSLNPAGQGAQLVFTVQATTNGGVPSGAIQLLDGTTSIGNSNLNASGVATFNTSSLAIGTHTLVASYGGDALDTAATSSPVNQIVQAATIAVTLSSSKPTAMFGDTVSFTASVTGTGSSPSGTVTFSDGTVALATQPVDPAGHAVFTSSTLSIGAHAISATYNGDANHAVAVSVPVQENVLQITSTTLVGSANHLVAGLPVTFVATVAGASGKPMTGTVTLTDGLTTLASLTPDANGLATYKSTMPVGQHSITAAYSGDATNAVSSSAPQPLLVEIATTTTNLATSANPSFSGSPLTLTASVNGNGAAPAGSVVFHDGSTVLGSVPLDLNGTAALSISTLAPGVHSLSASYGGDANDQPSVSPAISEQIAIHTTLTLTSSANPSLLTDNVVLTVNAANGSSAAPTGSITLTDGGASLATLTLTNGTATYTLASAGLGTHALVANYLGDSQNSPATAPTLIQTVTLRPTVTGLTASSTALSAGQQLILVSAVQSTGPLPATGQVIFQSGPTILGTVTISNVGLAALTLTPSAATLNVTAHYSGDSLYAASTSGVAGITVGPPIAFNLTANPASMTVQSGQHSTLTINIASAPSFKDTLSFGCAGLPADATCTFSKTQMAVTPGLPQTVDVTVDTGNPLGAGATAKLEPQSSSPVLACLLPAGALFLFAFRRRLTRGITLLTLLLTVTLTVGSLTGCSSSFSQSATPAGNYVFQIVATGATTGATQAAGITLAVTK